MELRFTYAAEEHRHILYSLIKIRMVNCLNQSFTMVLVLTIFFNTFLKLKQTIYIDKQVYIRFYFIIEQKLSGRYVGKREWWWWWWGECF